MIDVDYLIAQTRKMGSPKAVRYLDYHLELQYRKVRRLNDELNETKEAINRLLHEKEEREKFSVEGIDVPSEEVEGGEREDEKRI